MRHVVSLLLALAAGIATAQDAVEANPGTHRETLRNDRVRVFEAVIAPGAKENLHSHPHTIVHVVAGGKMRNHFPDGRTNDAELVAGTTLWRDPLTHWAENIGDTTVRVIVVEMQDAPTAAN